MKLVYKDKVINLVECRSFFSRFKGFMGQKKINKALLFKKCNSIHTFFMKEHIDVIFCDDDNIIMYYYKDLSPNRIIWPRRGATKVYELPVNYFNVQLYSKLEVRE